MGLTSLPNGLTTTELVNTGANTLSGATTITGALTVGSHKMAVSATISLATEAADMIAATVTLRDSSGTTLDNASGFTWYLSDAATGAGVSATAPDGGVAAGASGILAEFVADKCGTMISSATGVAIFNITESTAKTFYLVIILASGARVISSAITFAA